MILATIRLLVFLSFSALIIAQDGFICGNEQRYCRWLRPEGANWSRSHDDCARSGGSLVAGKHRAYIEEWMNSTSFTNGLTFVWTSLHLLNNRFQWMTIQPEYLPISREIHSYEEWVQGHPVAGRECVAANHRMQYQTVFCNQTFPTLCVIDRHRMFQLHQLSLPESQVEVNLTATGRGIASQSSSSAHLVVSGADGSVRLTCNASNRGGRILEYSWMKDGVYLGINQSVLTLPIGTTGRLRRSGLSKRGTISTTWTVDQGMYHCQVREFGSFNVSTSNAILITYRTSLLNGIVTHISPTGTNVSLANFMETIVTFIETEVLRKQHNFQAEKVKTSWNPLTYVRGINGDLEERIALYIDVVQTYDDNYLHHLMDEITRAVNVPQRLRTSGLESVRITWANYCPRQKEIPPESLRLLDQDLHWRATWSDLSATILPLEGHFCIRRDNGAELLGRQCLPDFTKGAEFTPLSFQNCLKLIAPAAEETHTCRSGYDWLPEKSVCYRVTNAGTWELAMAPCVSDWPVEDYLPDYALLESVARSLQVEGKVSDLWLPVRRASIYGPLVFNASAIPEPDGRETNTSWNGQLPEMEECLQFTKEGGRQVTNCSAHSLPGLCVYTARRLTEMQTNLCPTPWHGYRVRQGRLVCFKMVNSSQPMSWQEAKETCSQQRLGFAANVSLATLEDLFKAQLWRDVLHEFQWSIATSAWIGLRLSEPEGKFCWHGVDNCSFRYFSWHPETNWKEGRFGVMLSPGSWALLSSQDLRSQAICQATFDLALDQSLSLYSPNGFLDSTKSAHRMDDYARTYSNLSEFFRLDQWPWRMHSLPALDVGIQIRCYTDGRPEYSMMISWLPNEVPLFNDGSTASIFHCEGWLGWNPRRFIRSKPILLHPLDSWVFVLFVETPGSDSESVIGGRRSAINLQTDLGRRAEAEFHQFGVNISVSSPGRWWSNQRTLVRMLVKPGKGSRERSEQDWLDLLHNTFRLPSETYRVVEIRSTVACPKVTELVKMDDGGGKLNPTNLTWSSVPIGQLADPSHICLTDDGLPAFQRKCSGNPTVGAYWNVLSELPSNGICKPATSLLTTLRNLTNQVLSNGTDPSSALSRLTTLSTQWDRPNAAELNEASRLLHLSAQRIAQPSAQQFHSASQTLASISSSSLDQLAKAQFIPGFSNSLVASLEQLMGQVDLEHSEDATCHHPTMTVDAFMGSGLQQGVVGYGANLADDGHTLRNTSRILNETSVEELVAKDVAILLPMEEIRYLRGDNVRLSFSILPDANLLDAKPVTHLAEDVGKSTYKVDSAVVIAQVGTGGLSHLTQSVRIFFRSRSTSDVKPVCVFWDASRSDYGRWSSVGCRYAGRSQELHICECNHLTPLALLVPYVELPAADRVVLGLISIVGCALSMVALALVMLTFLMFSKWRQSLGNKILFNLCLALFGLLTSFLLAGQLSFHRRSCMVTSLSIHYFLLASFAWMLVEAVYQYVTYVVVVGAVTYRSRFMWKAGPIAWGLPVIPVIGILIYDPALYLGQRDFCWLDLDAFYAAVIGPIVAVIVVNLSIYVFILKSVLCVRKMGLRSTQSSKLRTWYQFRMAVCVFFLLGLTWFFGLTSVGDASVVFAYLFCIFNSLQGFAIFFFFVLREKNAKTLWTEYVKGRHDNKTATASSHLSDYSSSKHPSSRLSAVRKSYHVTSADPRKTLIVSI